MNADIVTMTRLTNMKMSMNSVVICTSFGLLRILALFVRKGALYTSRTV